MKYLYKLILLLLAAIQLNAATVTNSLTYYDHQVVDSWFTDSTNTLFVPQFNPAIGTPIKAEVYLKLNITNKLAFENRDAISWANPDFIGNVGITNAVNVNFFGTEVFNLFVTNTFNSTGFDGIIDFAGTSGFIGTNIVQKLVVFDVDVADISGYGVWGATNVNSARTFMRMNTGDFVASVYTTAGVDIWTVYTYTTTCPDCDNCDKDKDSDKDCDKDKDNNDKDKDKDSDKDKDDKDCKPDKDPKKGDKDKDKKPDNRRR